MIELYHFPFSTCSQKVRLVLAEKGLDFVSH
jgi:glutathione S-transferase